SAAIVETGSPVIENELSASRYRLDLHVHHARRRFVKQRTQRPGEDDALAWIDEGHMHMLDAPALREPLAKTAADVGSDGEIGGITAVSMFGIPPRGHVEERNHRGVRLHDQIDGLAHLKSIGGG